MEAEQYCKKGNMTVNEIASESKKTLYKNLKYRKVEIRSYVHQNDSKSQMIDNQQVIFYEISKIENIRC